MKNATSLVSSTFGVIVGIAGFEHGVGEMLQGNVTPAAPSILSWPNSSIFKILGGEPAMTILPNLTLAGILTILMSIGIIIFSVGFIQKKFASLVMVFLSILLLLAGGGYAPPVLGVVTAIGALLIHTPIRWLKANLPGIVLRGSSRLWPWVFGICLTLWFYLFPGSIILSFLFGLNNPMLIIPISFSALGFLILTFIIAFGSDVDRARQGQPA